MPQAALHRILYVDDETALLEVARLFLLRTSEFIIDTTENPLEAYDMIMAGRYDAVVSDYQMPEMDGIALLKRIREAGSQVPFIVFTGRGREDVAIEALNNGADFYIQKGGDPKAQFAVLANTIRQLARRRKAEAAASRTERMLHKAESLAHLGSWDLDCETWHLTWSDETYRIFGLKPGECVLTYEAFLSMVHPDDRSAVDTTYFASLADGKDTYTIEHRLLRAGTGEVRYVVERCEHQRDESGRVFCSFGMVHDITEAKRAEQRLRESEQHFRTLADSGHALIWTRGLDTERDYFNKQWFAFTGRTLEQEIGGGWIEGVHPDDRKRCVETYASASARREPFGMIYRLRRHDGEYRWIQDEVSPRYDTRGTFLGYIGHCLDVTELRQTKAALQETAERMESIFRVAPTGIGMAVDGVITEVNQQVSEITGYTRDELIGQPIRLLYPGETGHAADREALRERIEKTGRCTFETRFLRKNGAESYVQISITPIDPADLSRGMVFTALDISENKALEQEIDYHAGELIRLASSLATVNKKLNLMNSLTLHDIGNQLMVLTGNLSFALDAEPGQAISYLSRVKGAAGCIQRQIEFARDYTDIGVQIPGWQRISDAIRSAAPGGLSIEDESGDLFIYADPMLTRVFANLMDNTIRHGGGLASRVHVRYRLEDGGGLTLIWEDNGIGIPAGEKEHIFKRGFGKNTGLGLFLIREILGITGISITETGEPGKGARFEMRVPDGVYRI